VTLKQKTKWLVAQFPEMRGRIDLDAVMRSKTFRDIDNAATAPIHGFRDADDYYARLELDPLPRRDHDADILSQRWPTILPAARSIRAGEACASEAIEFRVTANGGHTGFIAGALPWRCEYWAEELVIGWLADEHDEPTPRSHPPRRRRSLGPRHRHLPAAALARTTTTGPVAGLRNGNGLRCRAPMRFVLGLIIIPILWTFALRPLLTILGRDDTRAWARNAFVSATAGILWFAIITHSVAWVVIAPSLVLAVVLAMRKADAHFSRHDLILLPVLASVNLALLDLLPRTVDQVLLLAAAIVFAIRLAIIPIRRNVSRQRCVSRCTARPRIAIEFQQLRHPALTLGPLAFAIVTPFLLRALIRDTAAARARFRAAQRYIIFPLAAYAYLSATSQLARGDAAH